MILQTVRLSLVCLGCFLLFRSSAGNIFCENQFERGTHERLDEKNLREKSKRKIEAEKFEPVRKKRQHIKRHFAVRIVQERGNQAHRRTHQGNRGTDNSRFKNHRMRLTRIERPAHKPERRRTSHNALKRVREAEFRKHDSPNRNAVPEQLNASHRARIDSSTEWHPVSRIKKFPFTTYRL